MPGIVYYFFFFFCFPSLSPRSDFCSEQRRQLPRSCERSLTRHYTTRDKAGGLLMQRCLANPTASSREVVINEPAWPAIRNPTALLRVLFGPETWFVSSRRTTTVSTAAMRAERHQQNQTGWREASGFHSIQPPCRI